MKRRSITISISGVIVLLATIIISAICIDDWSGLTGWAFSAILWSEIIFFCGLVFVEWIAERTEQIITRASLYVILSAYAIINIPGSILYIAFYKDACTSFAVVEVALLSLAAVAIVVSLATSKSIRQSNEKTMNAVATIEAMVERLNKLAIAPECKVYSSALKKVSEDLKFTDISVSVPEDAEIDGAISSIEVAVISESENATETIKEALIRLNSLISKRKISTSSCKKGRI